MNDESSGPNQEEVQSYSNDTARPQQVGCVVLPGEDVTEVIHNISAAGKSSGKKAPKIGCGLTYYNNDPSRQRVVVTHAGRLVHRKSSNTYMVVSNYKRYIPNRQDRVIGIVEERMGDYYRCNIFGPHSALLPTLAFEGATKRNKPNLSTGSTVYCRVVSAPRDIDPELSCKVGGGGTGTTSDGGASRKDWLTGECTYGELKGGTLIKISIGLARELIHPKNVVLEVLGKSLSFETAVGVNGVLWVNSPHPEHTILICNAIKNSEVMPPDQTRAMVRSLLSTVFLNKTLD